MNDLVRRAVASAASCAVLGTFAGGIVFAVEAADRVRVLRHNMYGPGEWARLVLLTAAIVLVVAVGCAVFGAFWSAADAWRRWVEARLPARVTRWRPVVAWLASAASVAVVLRVLSALAPLVAETPVLRVIHRFDARLVRLGPIAAHPKVVYTLVLSAATAALMLVVWRLFSERGKRAWIGAGATAVVLLLLAVGGYVADSRVEFTRYESMFHIPLEMIYSALALGACVAAARVFGDPARVASSRVAVAAAAALVALGGASFVYGATSMDANQNVKALFWGRSIVARRAFQIARWATDRDGDGFSPAFGGGDLDDANPSVNPMATEVAGNGVDDNCIGGDLASSPLPKGSLYAPETAPAAPAPVAAGGAPRDILILSVDCLRADHLSCYGYARPTSPNLDRFAAESLVFEQAYAQGTNTGHSFTSLFRSSFADDIFDDRIPTVARIARDAGYETQFVNAIRTDAWLNANRWSKYKTLMADFDVVHADGDRFWNAPALTDRAIATIDAQDRSKPHLTWVHYFDCHRPRARHKEHDFGRSAAGVFDSNVAFVDDSLGKLFDHLRETGALDRTIVFVIADHGEAFMEHGAVDHSNKPYLNNTLVPLIVRAPGATPARFPQPVGLVDLGPTALAFAGLAVPPFYRGVDLLAAARVGGPPARQIVSETPRNLIESSFYSWALVDWPYKILWDVRSNATEIYDLSADPGEQRSLADREPDVTRRMRAELGGWLDRETARSGAVGSGDDADEGDGD